MVEQPGRGQQERADTKRDDDVAGGGVRPDRFDLRCEIRDLRVDVLPRYELEPRHDEDVDFTQRRDGHPGTARHRDPAARGNDGNLVSGVVRPRDVRGHREEIGDTEHL